MGVQGPGLQAGFPAGSSKQRRRPELSSWLQRRRRLLAGVWVSEEQGEPSSAALGGGGGGFVFLNHGGGGARSSCVWPNSKSLESHVSLLILMFKPTGRAHRPAPPRSTVRFVMVSAPPLPAGFLGGYFFWLLHKIDSVPVTSPQAKKQQPFLLSSSCLCQCHPHSSWGTQDPVARTLVASDLSVTPFTRGNDPEAILSLHRGPGK